MKTYFSLKKGLIFGLVSVLMFTSCQNDEISEASLLEVEKVQELTDDDEESDPTLRVNNSILFPTTARLLGKSYGEWAIELGKTQVALDCEKISQAQLLYLSDKVVTPYGTLDNASGEYTIKKDQFVFLPPVFFFNNHPCPAEYEWEPSEGQSMEDFLRETAKEIMDVVETLEVFFDGKKIQEINNYRLNTDLFYFSGNPELTACYDQCISGGTQPGLIDGYFLMFKKMKFGKHTIFIKGEMPSFDYNFEITHVFNVNN